MLKSAVVGLLSLLLAVPSLCQQTPPHTTLPTSQPGSINASATTIPRQNPGNPPHLVSVPRHGILHGLTHDFQPDLPSSAEFERPLSNVDLLALKVDHSLMSRLDQWLGRYGIKMPQSVLKTIDEMPICPEHASDGMIRKSITHFILTL